MDAVRCTAVGGYCTYVANCMHIRTYSVVVSCVHFQLGGVCAVLVVIKLAQCDFRDETLLLRALDNPLVPCTYERPL